MTRLLVGSFLLIFSLISKSEAQSRRPNYRPPQPFTVSAYTNPTYIQPDIAISINGTSAVISNFDTQSHAGTYNPASGLVTVQFNGDPDTRYRWTAHIRKQGQSHYLSRFIYEVRSNFEDSAIAHDFYPHGLIAVVSGNSRFGQGYFLQQTGSITSYTYLNINGKYLQNTEGKSSFGLVLNNGRLDFELSDSQSFYSYDALGNETGYSISAVRQINGAPTTTLYYRFQNGGTKRTGSATAKDRDAAAFYNASRRAGATRNEAQLEKLVPIKTVESDNYTTEYYRDLSSKVFVPKLYRFGSQKSTYIVQGLPDISSGENDDIFIKIPNYFYYMNKIGMLLNVGSIDGDLIKGSGKYGLLFGALNQLSVEFPAENELTFDGIRYLVSLDAEGYVNLTPQN